MSLATDKAIKIPAQHYVGFNKRGDHEVPLGFMTPDGTDSAAQKRKQTVDNWAAGGYYSQNKVKLPAQTFENKPLSGFKFGNEVRHGGGWGQGNVKWRVEDPRGFELEISSHNLAQIMMCSTIENGEILDKCIWGRLGAENILIPVTSDVYKNAVANTERASTSADIKTLKVGNRVVLQNGVEGRYLGAHFGLHKEDYAVLKPESKKKHFVETIIAGPYKKGDIKYETYAALKVSSIIPGDEITLEEAEAKINEVLRKDNHAAGYKISRVSSKLPTLKYTLEPVNINHTTSLGDTVVVTLKDFHGNTKAGYVNTYYIKNKYGNNNAYSATEFNLDKLLNEGKLETYEDPHLTRYYGEKKKQFSASTILPDINWFNIKVDVTYGSGAVESYAL